MLKKCNEQCVSSFRFLFSTQKQKILAFEWWLELRATLSALEANRSAVTINFNFLVFQFTLKRMKSLFKVLSQTSGRQTLRLHHFHDIETPAVDILSDGS